MDSHQVYISEIENGKKIPSLSVIYKTAQFFNLSLSDFAAMIEEKL
ncbi:MAG: helix-turn-helix domain-containing protein [Treponema sp.]